jgi:hypothetical protein
MLGRAAHRCNETYCGGPIVSGRTPSVVSAGDPVRARICDPKGPTRADASDGHGLSFNVIPKVAKVFGGTGRRPGRPP